jgi:hypothetical protein
VAATYLLSAPGHELGLVLAQVPALLADLVLDGCVVTLNTAFTDRPVTCALPRRGHYLH